MTASRNGLLPERNFLAFFVVVRSNTDGQWRSQLAVDQHRRAWNGSGCQVQIGLRGRMTPQIFCLSLPVNGRTGDAGWRDLHLQENATRDSWSRDAHRTRVKPFLTVGARHRRYFAYVPR